MVSIFSLSDLYIAVYSTSFYWPQWRTALSKQNIKDCQGDLLFLKWYGNFCKIKSTGSKSYLRIFKSLHKGTVNYKINNTALVSENLVQY